MKKRMMFLLAIAGSILLVTTSAMALTTTFVSAPGGDGDISTLEKSQEFQGILDRLYGWENLMRIDDDLDHSFSLTAGDYAVYGEAKYAGWDQEIGVRTSGGDQYLISVDNNFDNGVSGNEATHVGYFTLASDEEVKFFDNSSNNPLWTTDPNDNDEGGVVDSDQAVTYKIMNGQYKGDYIIAFEDKNGNDNGDDWDFNDMVVRVSATPEPGTIMLLGLGLLGLGIHSRRKMMK